MDFVMKPKRQQKRQSLRSRAYESCGRSNCGTCYNITLGDEMVCRVCYKAYADGYTKGYKTARRERK